MPIVTGTHTIADLISNVFSTELVVPNNVTAMNEAIQRDLALHNQRTEEIMRTFADVSTERSTAYGVNSQTEMHSADEFTRGPTQKAKELAKVEFPLDKKQHAVGWTSDYLRRATVQDMARMTVMARSAHVRALSKGLRDAFFDPTNYTWVDRIVDSVSLGVKRLLNADSAPIPEGPNGETFTASTHTHYNAIDWDAAYADDKSQAVRDLISDVVEHGHSSGLMVLINRAEESDVRALSGFTPLMYPNIVAAPGGTAQFGVGTLDITQADNRLIGYFDGFPVWTKSWVPANYMLATATTDGRKPLRMRVSTIAGERGLFVAGEIVTFPLQARYMEAFFGFGAHNRTNGAVLYLSSDTYAAPTF